MPFMNWLSVEEYKQMLAKSGNYLFVEFYFGTYLIRLTNEQANECFSFIEGFFKLGNLSNDYANLNAIGFFLGLILIWLSHVLKFHKPLSVMTGLRKNFDTFCILFPLAALSNSDVSIYSKNKFLQNRDELMEQVFYKYCSSTKQKALVDKHYVTSAMTAWSWVWVALEGMFLLTILAVTSVFFFVSVVALKVFLVALIIYGLMLPYLYQRCVDSAAAEINVIAKNSEAMKDIKKEFDAL